MSQIIDTADKLRRDAISLLVAERQEIDQKLKQLGFETGDATSLVDAATIRKTRTVKCGVCGAEGHTARSCKSTPSETPE